MEVDAEDQADAEEDRRLHEQRMTATDNDKDDEWEDLEAHHEQIRQSMRQKAKTAEEAENNQEREEAEGRKPTMFRNPKQPSQEERDFHDLTHPDS